MPFTVVVLRHPMSVCQPIGAGCSQVQVQQALPGDWTFWYAGSASAIATGIIPSHPILVSIAPIQCTICGWIRTVVTRAAVVAICVRPLFTIFTQFILAHLRNCTFRLGALVLTGGDSACLVQTWILQHTVLAQQLPNSAAQIVCAPIS